jgi:hypothetical protein
MSVCRLVLILSLLTSMAFADTEKDQIFSTLTGLPKMTTAKIRRGTTETPIDLSSSSAQSKIQDYDVIILDEGVYSTLGNFTAKYVRVRGQGARKTFISSIAPGSSPILVNSTEFWDLTIADAQFKISDLNGLWAVNVEFAGSILVRPAAIDKSPAFSIRSTFSELTHSDLAPYDDGLNSHFLSKHGTTTIMPLPGDYKELREKRTAASLLAFEDQFDTTKDLSLKHRIAYKGLIARGMNYLYQKEVLSPQYDQAKFNKLAKNARATKAQGHLYVSMLYWAEADRLSGHSRFDEVIKEITPISQRLSQECGCTVEGQGLASTVKSEIEQKLYAKLPITALPGRCKIQTFSVKIPAGGKKAELIAAARMQNKVELTIAYQDSEARFLKNIGNSKEEEFLMGAAAPVSTKDNTAVADVEMKGSKKSYTSDNSTSIDQNIIDPIAKMFKEKFASIIKAAKTKIASSNLDAKFDGFMTQLLYGDEPARQKAYDDLFEQQFDRKLSQDGAVSSVFAY